MFVYMARIKQSELCPTRYQGMLRLLSPYLVLGYVVLIIRIRLHKLTLDEDTHFSVLSG